MAILITHADRHLKLQASIDVNTLIVQLLNVSCYHKCHIVELHYVFQDLMK